MTTRSATRRWLPSRHPSRFFPFAIFLALWTSGLGLALFITQAEGAQAKHEKPYALIFGTVWGPDTRPLYGVRIQIRRAGEKRVRWELVSDHQGEFAQRVPAGPADYVVTADLKGFKSQSDNKLKLSEDVKVHVDNEERQDIGLHLIK